MKFNLNRQTIAPMAKIFIIGVLALLLLIPLSMVRGVIREREGNRARAEADVMERWGGPQTAAGPFLAVPYRKYSRNDDGELKEIIDTAFFLPDKLVINGDIAAEIRTLGIYDIPVYTAMLSLTGSFGRPDFSRRHIQEKDILWEDSAVYLEIPYSRAIADKAVLSWDESEIPFENGGKNIVYTSGINAPVNPGVSGKSGGGYDFSFNLNFRGSGSLDFLPFAEDTKVKIKSDWQSPGFIGSYLPDSPDLSDDGFSAEWNLLSLGRNYPQSWLKGEVAPGTILDTSFGVNLVNPVDGYQKTIRSVKYGLLFLILPFLAFYLFELFSRKKIHPVQYLFTGLGISVFYLLLLSLSEHIPFDAAYLSGSLSTTLLISLYSRAVLGGWKRSGIIAAVLSAMYLFLYVILLSEDYALLIGSAGLFVILAAVMFITRSVNWYGNSDSVKDYVEDAGE